MSCNESKTESCGRLSQTTDNNAMFQCPKHGFEEDCKLTPAWICKKYPCKIDRTQQQ